MLWHWKSCAHEWTIGTPDYRAWFPDGWVDYWQPRSGLIRVAQAVKAVVTRCGVDTPMKTITGL
jgi:hypothetical protein